MNPRSTTEEVPRYATLRDYIGVVRRHRVMIALITVGFVAASLLISFAQHKTWEATASLQFRDICQDAGLVGPECVPQQPAPVRAASGAQLIGKLSVAKAVQKDLDTNISIARLQDAIDAAVTTGTLQVKITASATNRTFAADLANAYAKAVKAAGDDDVNKRLGRAEDGLKAQIDDLSGSSDVSSQLQSNLLEGRLRNIQLLESISVPVEIVQRAEAPNSPASPNKERNVALGLIVGLFFGVLAAFMRDSLDRRLHSVQEIHHELGMPVLGRIADTAMGYPGLASNGRVAMSETDFEAFRILRTNLAALSPDSPPRTLMVTSGLPEEGKSTVSMSLASAAALAGQRVLLVECDLRRPSFASRLGVKREPGLTDYLVGKATPQDVLQTVDLREPATFANGTLTQRSRRPVATLVVISAGSAVNNPAELLISERFKEFLAKVGKAYDMVVIDSSPVLAVADPLELVGQVDGVLVCIRAQQATRDEARATRAAFAHVPDRPFGAVVTGLRRGGADSYEYYYYGE